MTTFESQATIWRREQSRTTDRNMHRARRASAESPRAPATPNASAWQLANDVAAGVLAGVAVGVDFCLAVGTLAWRSLTLVPLSDYRVASVHVNDIKAVSNVFAAPLAHSRVCAFNSQNSSSSVFFTAVPRVDRE